MRVLIGCEFSGVVRRAFRELGHDAWSCDLLPAMDGDRHHYQEDVLKVMRRGRWQLILLHPPCTYILNSGCKHLYKDAKRWLPDGTENPRDPVRWRQMEDGARFFKACLEAPAYRVCVENPIMVGHALAIVGRDYDQLIQPWQFGHGETKATCLWLKNLPPLRPTKIVYGREQRIHNMSPGENRGQLRSITYHGIAAAMAAQWGSLTRKK